MEEKEMCQGMHQEMSRDIREASAEIVLEREVGAIVASLEWTIDEKVEEHARTLEERDIVKMRLVWTRAARSVAGTIRQYQWREVERKMYDELAFFDTFRNASYGVLQGFDILLHLKRDGMVQYAIGDIIFLSHFRDFFRDISSFVNINQNKRHDLTFVVTLALLLIIRDQRKYTSTPRASR